MSQTMPPPAVIADVFVSWLESRGASLGLNDADELRVNFNPVPGMTYDEADEIAAALFDLRDEVRAVLLARRRVAVTSH